MSECVYKNMIDDEYSQTAELEMRCVDILHHLRQFHNPSAGINESNINRNNTRPRRDPCQRFARNCATRGLATPHHSNLRRASQLFGCVDR
jgi:hypothetical protein